MRDQRIQVMMALLLLCSAGLAVAQEAQADRGPLEKPLTRQQVGEIAGEIDALVERGLDEAEQRPNLPIDEDRFMRRTYLNIVGRIPTYQEVREYRRRSGRRQRALLIDKLLESEGYVSHSYNYWADVLRIVSNLNGASGEPYAEFVKQSLRENKPYDQFVYELLTAEGRLHENGAVGYFVRDDGMPLDNTANTVRIFLGTSIGCAQCHDHPFDQWSQMEFYEMAAYTFGVRTREGVPAIEQAFQQAQQNEAPPEVRNVLQGLRQQYTFHVRDTQATITLPHDYKYGDGEPGQPVEPFTIFGDVAEVAPNQSRRDAYARWLTSKDNPRFAMVIANRLWQRAFGVGVIEPVDEIVDKSDAFNEPLLDYLTQLMIDLDFDVREFQRVIYNTRSYQREASREEWTPGEPYYFPGPVLRRMTAEQVWDSFVTLARGTAADAIARETDASDSAAGWRSEDVEQMTAEEVLAFAEEIAEGGGRAMMMGGQGGGDPMVRASELPQPAPPGHFLWRFGQSDRQLIDNATKDPGTTQVLTLLNGPIDRILLRDRSYLLGQVIRTPRNGSKLDVIWLSILNRRPTSVERRAAGREIAASGDVAFHNLVWALLNTREFLFIQ